MPSGDTLNRNRSHRGHSTTTWKRAEHQQVGPYAFLSLRRTASNLSLSVPSGEDPGIVLGGWTHTCLCLDICLGMYGMYSASVHMPLFTPRSMPENPIQRHQHSDDQGGDHPHLSGKLLPLPWFCLPSFTWSSGTSIRWPSACVSRVGIMDPYLSCQERRPNGYLWGMAADYDSMLSCG